MKNKTPKQVKAEAVGKGNTVKSWRWSKLPNTAVQYVYLLQESVMWWLSNNLISCIMQSLVSLSAIYWNEYQYPFETNNIYKNTNQIFYSICSAIWICIAILDLLTIYATTKCIKILRKQIKIKVNFYKRMHDSKVDSRSIILNISRIILLLESSKINDFMFIYVTKFKELLDKLKDISSNVKRTGSAFVITNHNCNICGWKESFVIPAWPFARLIDD